MPCRKEQPINRTSSFDFGVDKQLQYRAPDTRERPREKRFAHIYLPFVMVVAMKPANENAYKFKDQPEKHEQYVPYLDSFQIRDL